MAARSLRFEFPMPPNIANERMHWRVKLNAKKAFYAASDLKQAAGSFPAPPPSPFRRATASVVMVLGAAMDEDNSAHRCKWVWDWLKTRGYIADDKKKVLHQAGYPQQRIKRGGPYRIEITLTELASLPKERAS